MIAVANKPIPVVPDTGTEKAARLAADPHAAADAHDDVVRVEVHDQPPRVALGLEEHPGGHRGALAPAATDRPNRWGAEPLRGWGKVVWAELHRGDDGG
jgi:hypothetical protein